MIIVMGLPGAGKTTVLKGVKSEHKILNYGDIMFEIEKEKYGIKDRDEMRKLPVEKQKEVQKLVSEKLSKETGKVILDTHCSVNTPGGSSNGTRRIACGLAERIMESGPSASSWTSCGIATGA